MRCYFAKMHSAAKKSVDGMQQGGNKLRHRLVGILGKDSDKVKHLKKILNVTNVAVDNGNGA